MNSERVDSCVQKVLVLLRDIKRFPARKDSRLNCRAHPDDRYQHFSLGWTINKATGVTASRFNAKFPELYDACRALIAAYDSEFEYTGIQINKDYATAPHVDANNNGESLIIGLGDYSGGRVLTEDSTLDCNGRFCKMDATKLHWTEPFEGERYTLVFFKGRRMDKQYQLRERLVDPFGVRLDA